MTSSTDRPWWAVLQVSPDADRGQIINQYEICLAELKRAKNTGMREIVNRERKMAYGIDTTNPRKIEDVNQIQKTPR